MKDNTFKEADKQLGEEASELESSLVHQTYPDTCALKSQELIIRDFGYKTDSEQMIEKAIELGAYEPGEGSKPEDVGKLLEVYNIPCKQTVNGNIYNIVYELAHGHRVIVGVNSAELSKQGLYDMETTLENSTADHTLIVTGIDYSNLDDVKVVLKDPGTGDVAKAYPMQDFIDAWSDSSFFMVSTIHAPEPKLDLPEMRYFDQQIGHLEHIGELPYEQFKVVYDQLNEVNFKRVEGWNELCEGLAKTAKGELDTEELKERLDNYIQIEEEAKSGMEEIFEDTEFLQADESNPYELPIDNPDTEDIVDSNEESNEDDADSSDHF